ncbi:unnamed protein product [Adineta ricciae]|uniref:Carboxylic ester hydrolase n=1 Tax=Adineta ricciae TaxID=249248 RepID=A0A814BFY4_ADIRI|nr:unnamed protein product [Adineta ricciae]CAF0929027.1 unnamed protein product [Adineta ricciae]
MFISTKGKLLLLISLSLLLVTVSNASPTAQTHQGIYVGHQVRINETSVNVWYGIPYAQQPIGNLRWMPPQTLGEANGTKDAYIPNACPQTNAYGIPITEACLTLNVYAPDNATNLPVYVWIHGGSFISGAGAEYDAVAFISTTMQHSIPVVFVTINYRLGLLGFLADKGLYDERSGMNNKSTTGNYGVLDQMMALDWIKKNIRGFGGDAEQITIGGESAGGASVTILLTSSLVTNGTFQRAIIQSGAVWPNAVSYLQDAINATGNVLRLLTNCKTLQCLRNLTTEEILTVQYIIGSKSIFSLAANPVIDNYVIDDTMENNYVKGKFQKVPVLIGANTNESSLFTCPAFNGSASIIQVQAFFHSSYNATIVDRIPSIYGPIAAANHPLTYLNIVFSNSWLHCGSRRVASAFSKHGLPSYFYTYNHLIPVAPPCFGVAHAAELVMLFPTALSTLFPHYNFTVEEQQFSTSMMIYWANFIRTSNPNYSGNLTTWNAYETSSDNDFVLDIDSQTRNFYYNGTCSHFWDLYAVTNQYQISSAMKSNQIMNYHMFSFAGILLIFISI